MLSLIVKNMGDFSQSFVTNCKADMALCYQVANSFLLFIASSSFVIHQAEASGGLAGSQKIMPSVKISKPVSASGKFNWSDLPNWKGLPKDHFATQGGSILSNETENSAARALYDVAYTKLLVGDLDEAETGFLRILQHYPSSDVAAKAEKALGEVAAMRVKENEDADLGSHKSSIEQLLIISGTGGFKSGKKESPSEKKIKSAKLKREFSIMSDGVLKGSYEDFIVNVGDRVFFENRSATLTKTAKELLKSQVEWLKVHNNIKVLVEGHADEQGSDDYNMTLSANRAGIVESFFLNEGIDPDRIKTRHFGKKQPVALCRKENCLKQNRRAITRLLTSNSLLQNEKIKRASIK